MSKKEQLKKLFPQLKKNQQVLFNMMYSSIDAITDDKVDCALKQVERTIQKNIDNLDKKIEQVIKPDMFPPLLSQLPNIKVNTTVKETQYCLDGQIPEKGDIFFYQSKYNNVPLQGEVNIVYYDSIRSINGSSYKFSEITIKPRSEIREEKINEILKNY